MKKSLWLLVSSPMLMTLLMLGCTGTTEEPAKTTTPENQNTLLDISVSSIHISCPASVMPDMAYKTARMWFDFEIHNPGETEVTLESFEYAVYGDEYTVTGADAIVRGEYPNRPAITPFGNTTLEFQLPYISRDENPALWAEMVKGNVTWRIEGVAHIRTSIASLDIPFECTVADYTVDMDERCLED